MIVSDVSNKRLAKGERLHSQYRRVFGNVKYFSRGQQSLFTLILQEGYFATASSFNQYNFLGFSSTKYNG